MIFFFKMTKVGSFQAIVLGIHFYFIVPEQCHIVLISVTRFMALLMHRGTVVTECSAADCKLPHGAYVLMRTSITNMKRKACVVLVIGAKEKNRARKGTGGMGGPS